MTSSSPKTAVRTLALLSLTFWGCEPLGERVLERRFPRAQWLYPDTVWGTLPISHPSKCRNLELRIDLEETYPWRNLYLLVWIEQPDGFRQKSRIQLVFTDSLGNWYQRSQKFRTFVARKLSFPAAGTYRIGLLPYLRTDTVPGIKRIALYAYPCP